MEIFARLWVASALRIANETRGKSADYSVCMKYERWRIQIVLAIKKFVLQTSIF